MNSGMGDSRCCFHTTHSGHSQVHEDHIGLGSLPHGSVAVTGLTDHLKVISGLKDLAHSPAYERVVVDE